MPLNRVNYKLTVVSRSFGVGQALLQSSYDAGPQFRHVVSATDSFLHCDFLQALVELQAFFQQGIMLQTDCCGTDLAKLLNQAMRF